MWRTSLTLLIGPQETRPQASLSRCLAGVTLATNSCHKSAAILCIHAYGDNLFFKETPMHNTLENNFNISSVAQSCPTLCDTMNHSTPGLPVHHQLPESTQTHVHWVGNAIQPSLPLLSPYLPALNLSQHQGLFKWVSVLHIRWPKYCSSSFNISPLNVYSGLILFRRTGWISLQS